MVSQPYVYQRRELAEPDWRRFPGWAGVSEADWESAQWQRAHCVKNVAAVAAVTGAGTGRLLLRRPRARPARARDHVHAGAAADAEHDGADVSTGRPGVHRGVLRRPGTPVHAAGVLRPRTDWPSHPYAQRDSLHEAEMWVVEGLTHRYPTKVLAEVVPTCPQYCGHCTRMDLVGNSTPQSSPSSGSRWAGDRLELMLDYLRTHAGGTRRGGLRRRRRQRAVAPAGGVRRPRCWRSTRSGTSGWPPRR